MHVGEEGKNLYNSLFNIIVCYIVVFYSFGFEVAILWKVIDGEDKIATSNPKE